MPFNPVNTYLQEAEDLLAEIEETALALDGGAATPEQVNQLFRAFHTIKGSGAMCGFTAVAQFTHHVETALDQVREGQIPVSPQLAELVLAAKDEIRLLLASGQKTEAAARESTLNLIALISGLSGGSPFPAAASAPGAPAGAGAGETRAWRILFRPSADLMACGGNPALLFRDLRKLGDCRLVAHTDDVPSLEDLQTGQCYLWWTMELETDAGRDAIRDVFMFVEDGSTLEIEPADGSPSAPPPAAPEPPPSNEQTQAATVHKALSRESTVRVPSERLDRLVGLVGELVVNQSRLVQAASQVDAPDLAGPVEEIERLVAELRDDVLGIRMMPIGSIFGRFRRLVHDLSSQLAKEIDLLMEGAETELDKSILDQLGEPLVHLLRNSIDHGIEVPALRREAGKPPRGTIRLSAVHTGSDVVVSVEDDGRGLNRAAIRAKAVDKQLIAADAVLSDKEILNLILLPGFSTASKVTSVSGRGVGMDVVKRQIDALRGAVSIASDAGRGTRISLRLPLTLAIIEGLLVEVGEDRFIVPMASVAENVELERAQRVRQNGRNVTAVRGELVPYIDLRRTFHLEGERPAVEKIVIVHHEDQRVGLVVDRVLGTHQTVIQSLGRFLRNIEVVSGSTVMGDGRVALILDIRAVVRYVERLEGCS